MIKAQQLPQEEVDRFTKESTALMTTVCSRCGDIKFSSHGLVYISLNSEQKNSTYSNHSSVSYSKPVGSHFCDVKLASESTDLLFAPEINEKVCISIAISGCTPCKLIL